MSEELIINETPQITDETIVERYTNFFVERFVYSVAELEDLSQEQRTHLMLNILEALSYLICDTDYLNLGNIKTVGNIINESYEVPKGLRRIGVSAGTKATFNPIAPNQIPNALNMLFYQYYHTWDEIDPFLREAMFNIKYMRIHPLEDGNKRSAKLILTANLWKEGLAPVIITKEDTDEYYDFINTQDYDSFAEFLKQRSNVETNTMCGFYKSLKGMSLTESVKDEDVKKLVLKIK